MIITKPKFWQISSAFIVCLLFFISCNKKHNNKIIDNALIHTTEELRAKGKTQEIITLNRKYISISQKQNYTRGIILGYINISNVYAMIGNYKKSMTNLNNAKELLKNDKDPYLNMRFNHEYSQMNFVMGLSNMALKYNTDAIEWAKKIKSDSIKKIFSNIYTVRGDFISSKFKDSTLIYYHKGLQEDDSDLNYALIGNYQVIELKNQDSAKIYFDKSLELLKNQEYWTIRRGIIYSSYGNYLFQEGRFQDALEYYEKASEIFLKTGRVNKLPQIYAGIIQASQLVGDKKKEEEYTQKSIKVKDDLQLSANKAIDLALTDTVQELESYKATNSKVLIIILCVGSAVAAVITFLLLAHKRKKKIRNKIDGVDIENHPQQKDNLEEIIRLAKENNSELFPRFYEFNKEFVKNLYNINPELSSSDIVFCIMIWLGFSSKEIAQYSFMEHRSVQTKKNRLRKKLNIDSEIDVYKFLRDLSVFSPTKQSDYKSTT